MKNPFYPIRPEGKCGTNLDCPDTKFNINADTYRFWKWVIRVISILLIIICVVIIIKFDDYKQVMASAFLGGILSMMVWLISVHHTDIINKEISQIDATISDIDNILHYTHSVVNFIDPIELTISQGNINNLHYRNLHLVQSLEILKSTESIDCSNLQLKWLDKTDCSCDDYLDRMCHDLNQIYNNYPADILNNVILWNKHLLEKELLALRNKQLKRKIYILCGNARLSEKEVKKRIKWANRFDKIFNHKKEFKNE